VLPKPIAVAPDVDDVAVVKQAVDQGGGHDLISKYRFPVFQARV
jgi:hypothetical protein